MRRSRRAPPPATRIAWPTDLVVEGDAVVGVVLPYVGERFYRKGMAPLPRYLSYLRRDEEGVDDTVRLVLMRQLTGIMGVLEHAGLVHGDLTGQNLLCAPPPEELIVLVDTDGIHKASKPRWNGATPDWKDPRLEEGQISAHDMQSDWYALALAIGRTVARSKHFPTFESGRLTLPKGVPTQVGELLERTFADTMDPDARPRPGEWAKALDSALGRRRARSAGRAERRVPGVVFEQARAAGIFEQAGAAAPRPSPRRAKARHARRRPGPVLAVFLAALLALLGIVAYSLLDRGPTAQAHAEAVVRHWTKTHLHAGPIRLRCPEGSSISPGVHYLCHAETRSGAVAKVFVRVGAHEGIRRRMHVIAYRRRAVLADIRGRYRDQHERGGYGLRSIRCPRTFSARPGTAFTCPAVFTDGVHNGVTVHLESRRGRYRWREDGTPVGGRASALR